MDSFILSDEVTLTKTDEELEDCSLIGLIVEAFQYTHPVELTKDYGILLTDTILNGKYKQFVKDVESQNENFGFYNHIFYQEIRDKKYLMIEQTQNIILLLMVQLVC